MHKYSTVQIMQFTKHVNGKIFPIWNVLSKFEFTLIKFMNFKANKNTESV